MSTCTAAWHPRGVGHVVEALYGLTAARVGRCPVRVECNRLGVFRDGSVCAGEEQARGRVWSHCPPFPAACHPRDMGRVAEALYGPTAARVGGCSMRLDWNSRASGILLGPPFSGPWPRGFFGRVRSRCCVDHIPGRAYCHVWISIGGGSPLLKAAGHC